MKNLLEIKKLSVDFPLENQVLSVLKNVSLDIKDGEIVGLAGESGSGKTLTALSICRILPQKARIVSGEVIFNSLNLLKIDEEEIRKIRGKEIAYIFQEPSSYLNPVLTIGEQIIESILLHQTADKKKAKNIALQLLELVKIPEPNLRIHNYPHQLSGGMNQRIMLAQALGCRPKLLIADEPTTALDITIETQILSLLLDLKKSFNFSMLFITHNLSILKRLADRIYVMQKGSMVESNSTQDIFNSPNSAYTKELIEAYLNVG